MSIKECTLDIVEKITEEKHINAIKTGMMAYVPFTIIGAVALLIAYFPSQAYIDFVTNLFGFEDASIWQGAITSIMNGSMNLGAIICTLFISYDLKINNSYYIMNCF